MSDHLLDWMEVELELAWAAGFFDGEGTISQTTASGTRRRYLLLRIGHVDPRPLEKFAAAVGGHVRGPYQQKKGNGRWSDYYVWQRAGRPAQEVIDLLWPYLADAKREQYGRVKERISNELPEHTARRQNCEAGVPA